MTSMEGRRPLPKPLAWLEHAKLSDAGEAAAVAELLDAYSRLAPCFLPRILDVP